MIHLISLVTWALRSIGASDKVWWQAVEDEPFSFPLYIRRHRIKWAKGSSDDISAQVSSVSGHAVTMVQNDELRALISAATIDFAQRSLTNQSLASPHRTSVTRFQTAVPFLFGAKGPLALEALGKQGGDKTWSAEGIDLHWTPHLSGLFLAAGGPSHVCLSHPDPNPLHSWHHGPSGEIIEQKASDGTLLLYHHSLRPSLCSHNSSGCKNMAKENIWIGFDVLVQGVSDSAKHVAQLNFIDSEDHPKKAIRAVRKSTHVGRIEKLWRWQIPLMNAKHRLPLSHPVKLLAEALQSENPEEHVEDSSGISCPKHRMNVLDIPSFSEIRAVLLNSAAVFFGERLGRPVDIKDLVLGENVLCHLPHDAPGHASWPDGPRDAVRGVYIAGPQQGGQRCPSVVLHMLVPWPDSQVKLGLSGTIHWPFGEELFGLRLQVGPTGSLTFLPSFGFMAPRFSRATGSNCFLLAFDVLLSKQRPLVESASQVAKQSCPATQSLDAHPVLSGYDEALDFFPTLVHVRKILGMESLNSKLRSGCIHAAKTGSSGVQFSNFGGWQSQKDWLSASNKELADDLYDELMDAVLMALTVELPREIVTKLAVSIQSWVNVNQPGNSNSLHVHGSAHLSGAYMVETGGGGENSTLQFWDPRRTNALGQLWRQLELTPLSGVASPGLLLIFPAWLAHYVPPHTGNEARVTVSFNVNLTWHNGGETSKMADFLDAWAKGHAAKSGRRFEQQTLRFWPSIVVHRRQVDVSLLGQLAGIAKDGSVSCQEICGLTSPIQDISARICNTMLSTARSAMCKLTASLGSECHAPVLRAMSRGVVHSFACGATQIHGLVAEHWPDALLWGAVVLNISACSDGKVVASFKDPRLLGASWKLLGSARHKELRLQTGSIVTFPPWLQATLHSELEEAATPCKVDLMAFDVYPS